MSSLAALADRACHSEGYRSGVWDTMYLALGTDMYQTYHVIAPCLHAAGWYEDGDHYRNFYGQTLIKLSPHAY